MAALRIYRAWRVCLCLLWRAWIEVKVVERNSTLFRIESDDWTKRFRFANWLIEQETSVFVVSRILAGDAGRDLGALVTTGDGSALADAAGRAEVRLERFEAKGVVELQPLAGVKVAHYGGGGAPFNHAGVLGACGFAQRFLSDAEIRAGMLDEVDVLIVPGGGFEAMDGQLSPLGIDGARAISDWVRRGGMYIGSCAGAFDCAIVSASFARTCPPKEVLQLVNARVWNEGSGELEGLFSPGVGVLEIENAAAAHPVMFGMPERFSIVHYNGPFFEVLDRSQIDGASLATPLATVRGATDAYTHAEAFMGGSADGVATVLERGVAAEVAAIVAGELGIGRVVSFGSHPEFGFDLTMRQWTDPARMLANAVTWQAANGGYPRRIPDSRRSGASVDPAGGVFIALEQAVSNLQDAVTRLRSRSVDPLPAWLASDYSMSMFGASPGAIWSAALDDLLVICAEIVALGQQLRARLERLDGDERTAVERLVNAWVLDRRDPAWRQDGGYQGVLDLLETARSRCVLAEERWETPLGEPAGPYGYVHENPYHLVAGSYLAAIGSAAGAWQLMNALATTAETALWPRLGASSVAEGVSTGNGAHVLAAVERR